MAQCALSSRSFFWKFLCLIAVLAAEERSDSLRRNGLIQPGPSTVKTSSGVQVPKRKQPRGDAGTQGAGSSMAVDNSFSIIVDNGKKSKDKEKEEEEDKAEEGEKKTCGDAEAPTEHSCR